MVSRTISFVIYDDMNSGSHYQSHDAAPTTLGKAGQMLRLIRAAQPITRTISLLAWDRPEHGQRERKPLIASGILREETIYR